MVKKKSQMLAVPAQYSDMEEPDVLVERLRACQDFTLQKVTSQEEEGLFLEIHCQDELFQVELYPMDFVLPELYRCQHLFPDVDVDAIQRAQYGLAVEMEFGSNPLASYHLQLKLIHAMLPEVLAVIDDSSEKILSGRWVALAAQSQVPPAPRYLFTAQAVSGEEDSCVWLHTHGLNRGGHPELEVLTSTRDNYQQHYNVLETLANRLLEEPKPLEYGAPFFLAYVATGTPLMVTLIHWEQAVKLYPEEMLGGKNDRQEGHNEDTCVVFVYPSQESLEEGRFSSLSIYDELLQDNPIFMISNEETARMRSLAVERISYFFDAFAQKDCKLLVKLGLLVDEEHSTQENDREHIWFEVLDISQGRIKARLTQEPYYIKGLHEGHEGIYGPEDVTDWLIFTPEKRISPDDVYLFSLPQI